MLRKLLGGNFPFKERSVAIVKTLSWISSSDLTFTALIPPMHSVNFISPCEMCPQGRGLLVPAWWPWNLDPFILGPWGQPTREGRGDVPFE